MAVTPETRAIATQAKAHTTHILDQATLAMIRAWARLWDDLQAVIRRDLARAVKRGELGARARVAHTTWARVVDRKLAEMLNQVGAQMGGVARQLATAAIRDTYQIITTQLPPHDAHRWLRPVPTHAVEHLIGRCLSQLTSRQGEAMTDTGIAIRRALLVGAAQGENPHRVAHMMVRQAETAFDGGLVRALVIARTELMDAYRAAAQETRHRNRHVLDGWIWQATLSDRTCPACWAMHGTVFPTDHPGPDDHHQGRCTSLPVVRPWADLGIRAPEPPGVRPSPGEARDAFEKLSPTQQKKILGAKRWEAYQAGDYPMGAWPNIRPTVDTGGRRVWRDSLRTTPLRDVGGGWRLPVPTSIDYVLSAGERTHWAARQAATGIETGGAILTPAEVRFVERMLGRGEKVEWLRPPRPLDTPAPPTPDFVWRGQTWELKSPLVVRRGVCQQAIIRAARKAHKSGAAKTRFVLDLGLVDTDRGMAEVLPQINELLPPGVPPIGGLWLMWADGAELVEVGLD